MEEREISWPVFVSQLFMDTNGGNTEKATPPEHSEIKEAKVEKEEKDYLAEEKVMGVKEIMEVGEEEEELRTPSTIQTANLF